MKYVRAKYSKLHASFFLIQLEKSMKLLEKEFERSSKMGFVDRNE